MEIWLMMILSNLIIMCLLFYTKIIIHLQYQRDGSDDYIAVNVYILNKLLTYSMKVPIIEIGDSKNLFWLKSKIQTAHGQDKTHIKREQRFVKKMLKFYILHPRKLGRVIKKMRHYFRLYYGMKQRIAKSLHCEQLQWKTIFGSEDAGLTGLGTGVLWSVKALILTRLQNQISVMQKPVINVTPIFGQNSFKVDFQCIFSIRFGNVIKAMTIWYNNKS